MAFGTGGMVDNVVRLPVRSRMAGKVALGKRLNLTDWERGTARAFSIMPVDVSEEELRERAKERDRLRKTIKRREERIKLRRIYEGEAASRTEPWKALGISRATYYRRRVSGDLRETSLSAMILRAITPDTLVSGCGADRSSPPKEGTNERTDSNTTTVRPANNNNRGCFAATRPVSGGEDRWSRVSKRQF